MHSFTILEYKGVPVQIDNDIVDLMKAIWSHGIETTFSCQDVDGQVWIQMPGTEVHKLQKSLGDKSTLLRVEYYGPAARAITGEHNVYFNKELTDALVGYLGFDSSRPVSHTRITSQ